MKSKIKQSTKKSAKTIPGISRTTQITFIVTAIAAYILQAAMSVQGLLGMPNILESFARWLPVYLIDGIVLPLLLFVLGYFVLNNTPSRVSRIFKATLVATIGGIVSMTANLLFMELFSEQLGYGSGPATWTSGWVRIIPVVIGLVGAAAIAWYGFKPVKDKEFTASRKAQKVFIGLTALTLAVNVIFGITGLVNGSNNGHMNSGEAFAAFTLSTLAIFVPMGILYLMASKAQTKLTRLFNALLYILILTFVASIIFTVMYGLKIYMHEPGSLGAILMPVLTYVILGGIVIVQKMQKAF